MASAKADRAAYQAKLRRRPRHRIPVLLESRDKAAARIAEIDIELTGLLVDLERESKQVQAALDANPPQPVPSCLSEEGVREKLLGEDARLGAFEALQAAGIFKSVDEHQEEFLWRIVDACTEGLVAAAVRGGDE